MNKLLSVLAFVALAPAVVLAEDARPNFVVIVAESLGRDWVSCYGGGHRTPNIDRLAEQGVRYETAWSMPLGTPSRVTLLTGQYPFRHGWTGEPAPPPEEGKGFDPKRFATFARVLRDAGYTTAVGGRWQVNDLRREADVLDRHGFDEHCIWDDVENGEPASVATDQAGHVIANGRRRSVGDGPDAIGTFLADFVQRKKDGPFLVYYPMVSVRGPLTSDSKIDAERYGRLVDEVDRLVGELTRVVDGAGLTKNTVVVFTSDNGSAVGGTLGGEPYPKGEGNAGDRGVHVPFIVRAPSLASGGRASRDLVDLTDVYPTLVELASTDAGKNVVLDGRSLVPSLRGSEDPFEKRNWIYAQRGDTRMIRDWQHIVDSKGGFHDLTKDPLQTEKVSPLDKIAPGRRQRLEMILGRLQGNSNARSNQKPSSIEDQHQ